MSAASKEVSLSVVHDIEVHPFGTLLPVASGAILSFFALVALSSSIGRFLDAAACDLSSGLRSRMYLAMSLKSVVSSLLPAR